MAQVSLLSKLETRMMLLTPGFSLIGTQPYTDFAEVKQQKDLCLSLSQTLYLQIIFNFNKIDRQRDRWTKRLREFPF